jgi:hypothetical protein
MSDTAHEAFNNWFRRELRPEPLERRASDLPAGDLGIGKGAAAGPPARPAITSIEVTSRIRRAALICRQTTVPQGVDPFA